MPVVSYRDLHTKRRFATMDHHKLHLRSACRLCGGQHDRLFPKEKWSGVLKRALDIDVGQDNSDVHPPSICILCDRKLTRWNAKQRKKQQCILNISVVTFAQHAEDCIICPSSSANQIDLQTWYEEALKVNISSSFQKERLHLFTVDTEGTTEKCITIMNDGSWILRCYSSVIDIPLTPFRDLPKNLAHAESASVFNLLQSCYICPGNPESFDLSTADFGSRPVFKHPGCKTVRHIHCPVLSAVSGRCGPCAIYRSSIQALMKRVSDTSSPAARTNYRFMRKDKLSERLKQAAKEKTKMKQRISSLEDTISKLFVEESEELNQEQHDTFTTLFTTQQHHVEEVLAEGTPQRLLWDEQLKALSQNPKQMRWHPAILRFCVAVQSKSPAAYDLLRDSGFLNLPHKNTLKQYTSYCKIDPGFNEDFIKHLMEDINFSSLPEYKHNVSIVMDEMKVKSGLIYSQSSGKVIGFTDLGDLNNELQDFAKRCENKEGQEPDMASHVFVLMVRGLCHSYQAPFAFFASTGMTSDQIYVCVWQAIEWLETYGFKVRAIVSDGAAPNRSFYSLHGPEKDVYCCQNPFQPDRCIFFVADVPRLIKTIRNNFENSGFRNKTRNMKFRSKDISWQHILQLYEWDTTSPSGLRKLPKLTYEHLHLTPSLRMRVKLAAQILSTSVANALEIQGRQDTESTVFFIRNVDLFFDCLNVSDVYKGQKQRKPSLQPYRSVDDWRFIWLNEGFLGFLDEWESEGRCVPGLTSTERERLHLSQQTVDGLRMTVKSFIALAKELLHEPGVEYFLSEKLSQDPLEEYFSKQRGMGGRRDNPDVAQFASNMVSLQVASACMPGSSKANVRASRGQIVMDDTPLPKRKKLF